MATIKDVAKKAGVAVCTASRALHNSGYVSQAARAKVKKAAKDLGYIVDNNALLLRDKKSKRIGILISDILNPYFTRFVKDFQTRIAEVGYGTILAVANPDAINEEKQLKYLLGNHVETVLFVPSSTLNEDILVLAKKNGINVIQLFVKAYDGYSSIINDDEGGAYLAAKQLIKEGCKRIALFDVKYGEQDFDREVAPNRHLGLERAIKEVKDVQGLTLFNSAVDDFSKDNISKLNDFAPDGIIAGTGVFGLKVLQYMKTNTIKAKLISFDDNEWFAFQGITCVRQNETKLMEAIINQILNNEQNSSVAIEENLIIRN